MHYSQGPLPSARDIEVRGAGQSKLVISPTLVTLIRDGQRHELPLLRIASIELIRPGPLGTGKLRLLVPGSGTRAPLVGGFEVYSIAFSRRQLDDFLSAQALIQQYQARLHRSNTPYTSAAIDETGRQASL